MRRRPVRPKGLKHCAVCGVPLIWLHQHTRWLLGRVVTVCVDHHRMPEPEVYQLLQQQLSSGTSPGANPQEVG